MKLFINTVKLYLPNYRYEKQCFPLILKRPMIPQKTEGPELSNRAPAWQVQHLSFSIWPLRSGKYSN